MDFTETFDKDVLLMCSFARSSFVDRKTLKINWSFDFNRKVLPTEYENNIDITWQERLSKNPILWNGTKFRLDSVTGQTFNVGLTCYKDFIGTNCSSFKKELRNMGDSLHKNPQAFLSDALGVGALVITADDKVIFIQRSNDCGEAQGMIDIPGGHPEPKKIVGKKLMDEIKASDISTNDIVEEIFDSTIEEIVNEVNIPAEFLSDPLLMGVARNTTTGGRPSSEYLVQCSLRSDDIRERYEAGTQEEANESTAIQFYPFEDIGNIQNDVSLWSNMAPSAKGCVILYQQASHL